MNKALFLPPFTDKAVEALSSFPKVSLSHAVLI
jgi:hypothetical protein